MYYAERCPDLSQTLQFVIGELEAAPHDPTLADYAVAQTFSGIRSAARYEERGEQMAADLADGLAPEVIRRFRRGILALRVQENLYEQLQARMPGAYGDILPGYGSASADAAARANAIYYVIGPSAQLDSWERYLESVEEDAHLHRLYPRDYWQVRRVAGDAAGD
jgi:hypothetical protein